MANNRRELDAILRSDFRSFLRKAFAEIEAGEPLMPNWHIWAIVHVLECCLRGECTRAIINLPPRHLKSLLVSVIFPVFLLGIDPTRKIACVSYSQELARLFGEFRRQLMNSTWYRQLFPGTVVRSEKHEEIVTTQGGRCYVSSIEGGLTGRGFHYILIDDPIKAGSAMSAAERNAVNDWIQTTAISRLEKKDRDKIVIAMQRVHEEDLSGYVPQFNEWHTLSLPAIAPEDEEIDLGYGETHFRKAGEALHEERESLAVLEQTRTEIGSFTFEAQYQQNPVPAAGNIFQREWFKEYIGGVRRDTFDQIIQSWDTAASNAEGASFSVCITFGTIENKAFVLDVFRDRLLYPDLKQKVIRLAHEQHAHRVLIEQASTGLSLLQDLYNQPNLNLIGIPPKGDKLVRAEQASGVIESGRLFLPDDAPWLADFMQELMAFPNGAHADQVDALSQFLIWGFRQAQRELQGRAYWIGGSEGVSDRYAERMGSSVFDNLRR